MVMTFLVWLGGAIGVGRAVALVASVVFAVGLVGGVYAKGYYSCVSKYELAAAKHTIDELQKELRELKEAQQLGEELARVMEEAEKANAETSTGLTGSVAPGTGCVDADWLRGLAKLR